MSCRVLPPRSMPLQFSSISLQKLSIWLGRAESNESKNSLRAWRASQKRSVLTLRLGEWKYVRHSCASAAQYGAFESISLLRSLLAFMASSLVGLLPRHVEPANEVADVLAVAFQE